MSRIARHLARFCRRLSRLLARAADRIDPPAPPAPQPDLSTGAQLRAAKRLCDRIALARALHDSLRRYSPREERAQA
jgi:hypothetical protein